MSLYSYILVRVAHDYNCNYNKFSKFSQVKFDENNAYADFTSKGQKKYFFIDSQLKKNIKTMLCIT